MTSLITRAVPFLNKLIPFGMASKGLSKIDPRFGKFIQTSLASGYTADEVMDFIRNKFSNDYENELESKENRLRPDQKATLEQLRQQGRTVKGIQTLATLGTGIGGGLASMPNEPEREPNKTSFGMQGKGSMVKGVPQDQTQNELLASELEKGYEQTQGNQIEPPPEVWNPIEALAPNLHKFLDSEIKNGRSPIEALNLAKTKGFLKDIELISKKLGTRLFDVINQIYEKSNPTPQPSQGPGQKALMDILQKLTQARGG